jgi:hypothetical protein
LETSKVIRIEQAYFGEKNGSHKLLAYSFTDANLGSSLISLTDAPRGISDGTKFAPFISGFSVGDFYVFTKTFQDISASRKGMVFTHALAILKSEVEIIEDLSVIFNVFVSDNSCKNDSVESLTISVGAREVVDFDPAAYSYIATTVNSILDGNQNPVVFIGDDSAFKTLIQAIWFGLPKKLRTFFTFQKKYAAQHEIEAGSIVLYHVDEEQKRRFANIFQVTQSSSVTPANNLAKIFLDVKTRARFNEFIQEIGIELIQFSQLTYAYKAFEIYLNLQENRANELESIQLLRIVSFLSPNPHEGTAIKSQIFNRVVIILQDVEPSQFLILRNLELNSFAEGAQKVCNMMAKRLQAEIISDDPKRIKPWISVIEAAIGDSRIQKWWIESIMAEVGNLFKNPTKTNAQTVWELIFLMPSQMHHLFNLIPTSTANESVLVSAFPKSTPIDVCKAIETQAKSKKWFQIHAKALLGHLNSVDALLIQLEVEPSTIPEANSGIGLIGEILTHSQMREITLLSASKVLLPIFGHRSKDSPEILLPALPTEPNWFQAWSASLQVTHNLQHGIIDIKEVIDRVHEQVVKGVDIPLIILSLISKSEYADIWHYKEREFMWANLPASVLTDYLQASSYSAIADALKEGDAKKIENQLLNFIKSDDFVNDFFRQNTNNLSNVLRFIQVFKLSLAQRLFVNFIRAYRGPVDEIIAVSLGRFLSSSGWKDAALEISSKAGYNPVWRHTLSECGSLFSIFEKWFNPHFVKPHVSPQQFYVLLQGLAIKLFPEGPMDFRVWQSAGGSVEKLIPGRSGEESWAHAINLLKNGGGGTNARELLKTMERIFSSNLEIKTLLDIVYKQ